MSQRDQCNFVLGYSDLAPVNEMFVVDVAKFQPGCIVMLSKIERLLIACDRAFTRI